MPTRNKNRSKRIYASSARVVAYLPPREVRLLAEAAKQGRNGERDSLFIMFLFQTGLRVSEGLSLTSEKLDSFEGKPVIHIIGKGNKPRTVSCPSNLAGKLSEYARRKGLNGEERLFPFNRVRAWQIIRAAAQKANFSKRIFPHLLRHSDAIERLKQTGNPKALQHHLGHSSISMVLRYLSTLTQEESIRIQQNVEFKDEGL